MNGGLSKSFLKTGTLDFSGNPSPHVDLIHQKKLLLPLYNHVLTANTQSFHIINYLCILHSNLY